MQDNLLLDICKIAHAAWCSSMKAEGFVYGDKTDLKAKTHPSLLPFERLSEAGIDGEKKAITTMMVEALALNDNTMPTDVSVFDAAKIDAICGVVHHHWIRQKLAQGLAYGDEINEKELRHPDIVPFNLLRENRKTVERNVVRAVLQGMVERRDSVAAFVASARRRAPIEPMSQFLSLLRTDQLHETRLGSVRLDLNEYSGDLPKAFWDAFQAEFTSQHFCAYPEIFGAYEALSKFSCLPESCLALAEGSDGIIRQICHVFLGEGRKLLLPSPNYGMYPVYARMFRSSVVDVPYRSDFTFSVDLALELLRKERPTLMAIAQPSGVFGSVVSDEDLIKIIRCAEEVGAVVLLDGVHADFYPDVWMSRVKEFENLALVRSFSKAGGLAGARFGFLLSSPWLAELVRRARPVDEISSASVVAGRLLLENPHWLKEMVHETIAGKDWLATRLEQAGFTVFRGHGNFMLVKFDKKTDEVYAKLLEKKVRVRRHPENPLLGEWLRITAGPVALMEKAWNILCEVQP